MYGFIAVQKNVLSFGVVAIVSTPLGIMTDLDKLAKPVSEVKSYFIFGSFTKYRRFLNINVSETESE